MGLGQGVGHIGNGHRTREPRTRPIAQKGGGQFVADKRPLFSFRNPRGCIENREGVRVTVLDCIPLEEGELREKFCRALRYGEPIPKKVLTFLPADSIDPNIGRTWGVIRRFLKGYGIPVKEPKLKRSLVGVV